jgi:serine phosphatase RsbU (regulator of sigma subunit)/outer membrane protein assembly factor BamD (BamD/ComL family)
MVRFYLILTFVLGVGSLNAQILLSDLQKGFRAIDKSNYSKAVQIFNGIVTSDSVHVGAHYGLAKIYFSKDFAEFNLDKAYTHIRIAEREYPNADPKKLTALNNLAIDEHAINQLSGRIDDELFSIAAADNSTEALSNFVRKYPASSNLAAANELLKQLNFFNADASNSENKLAEFIRNNPNSKDLDRAIKTRNMLAFQKAKAANTVAALNEFMLNYPDAEEVEAAMDALGSLEFLEAKRLNTIAAFDEFLTKYPEAVEYDEAMMQRNELAYIEILEQQKVQAAATIDEKNADIEKKGTQLNVFLIGSVILVLLMGLLYWNYTQKKKSNREITQQKEIIEQKNKEIVDSINYAKRIQEALLPSLSEIRTAFPESFVYYRPRDIVSGDFYWLAQKNNCLLIAAADCTGHGVPGSLVSMIGFNFLNELINENGITDPGAILNQLHSKIANTLNKDSSDSTASALRDGMDIALLCLNQNTREISFAGAVRPLYYIDEEGFKSVKSGVYSIGGIKSLTENPFQTEIIRPKGKAMFYLFSDGYADQFGGDKGKKFKMKKLQEMLQTIAARPVEDQSKEIESVFMNWMGNHEQVDDVCVIGLRV